MTGLLDGFVRPLRGGAVRPLEDRIDAGQQLAQRLTAYANCSDVLVLGLPRGGVPVAYEIAKALHAPLDVFVVRKLGVPGHEELAMGAIASGGVRVFNDDLVEGLRISDELIERAVTKQQAEIKRRERLYRGDRPPLNVSGKTVILVDDGIATGATLRAAIAALHKLAPAKIVVAVGVAPPETCELIEKEVDELVYLLQPDPFWAVGLWFKDFEQTSDEEVNMLLMQAADLLAADQAAQPKTPVTSPPALETFPVQIQAGSVTLAGDLAIPAQAKGLVLFVHGSGSSRFSPRNRAVAQALQAGGLATLLFDLLTAEEEQIDQYTRHLRFDISLLANRLVAATDWVLQQTAIKDVKIGYFGASTGAAAALVAAAQQHKRIAAVVSRGGCPDLAGESLSQVQAPTLLIVGSLDHQVLELNQKALAQLSTEAKLEIVPGATHLFEEPGTLEEVSHLALAWFQRHLG